LATALELMRTMRAGVLLVSKLDRLARSMMVSCAIERKVSLYGKIISADGTGNSGSACDEFTRQLMMSVAQLERSMGISRTKAVLDLKKSRGDRRRLLLPIGDIYFYRLGPQPICGPGARKFSMSFRCSGMRRSRS
jgi:DNA invertase Pin-like site-specific DNA recombinase